jgi:hypothetical protein
MPAFASTSLPSPSVHEKLTSAPALFNGYVGANLALAYQERGLFEALSSAEAKCVDALARETSCEPTVLKALLRAGVALGIVAVDENERHSLTKSGEEVHHNIGFFTWAIGGYGAFFRNLSMLAGEDATNYRTLVDGSMVALGSDQVNQALMRKIYDEVIAGLPPFNCVADLGCGNAGRLIDLCKRFPSSRGLGIDVNAGAVDLANRNVREHHLDDRITVYEANVLDAVEANEIRADLAKVELVTCFMMLHDLFSIEAPSVVMQKLRGAFPNARSFVFADTFRMPSKQEPEQLPIFSLGFELVHDIMGIGIHTPEHYTEAFQEAGLRLRQMQPFGAPHTRLFVLDTQP